MLTLRLSESPSISLDDRRSLSEIGIEPGSTRLTSPPSIDLRAVLTMATHEGADYVDLGFASLLGLDAPAGVRVITLTCRFRMAGLKL